MTAGPLALESASVAACGPELISLRECPGRCKLPFLEGKIVLGSVLNGEAHGGGLLGRDFPLSVYWVLVT